MLSRLTPYLEGLKRSIVTYTRLPLNVDWNEDIKHTPAVCFLPWVGVLVAILSAWPLLFDGLTASLQALFMLLTAVLLTGGFHEDGLMDACDGLVGGWTQEQRLSIMKDSRIGSYAALSIWFVMMLKWLLLTQVLLTVSVHQTGAGSGLLAWVAMHSIARVTPIVIMNTLEYVTNGQSKAQTMIAKLASQEWAIALLPCVLIAFLDFSYLLKAICVLALLTIGVHFYLKKKIGGFNGDTLGATEQLSEVVLLLCVLGAYA